MSKSLDEIAEQLRDSGKKVSLIYAFNGSGKTRLSKAFKKLIAPKNNDDNEETLTRRKILYFNAFTEDLFYWNNDLINDSEPKLKIQPNSFINWLIEDQGYEDKIISKFHHYCDEKLMPKFDIKNNQITFSFARGNDEPEDNIKLSKGEESNFIWSIFHTLIEQAISELNIPESNERSTDKFDELEYIFIDDPVSSLDENHLIQLAVDLAKLIKDSQSEIKFIITTHNPLFYNVLYNETPKEKEKRTCYMLRKGENNMFKLEKKPGDSNKSFSYHLYLKKLLEDVESKDIQKYHFMLLRNLYEKTANFLGYSGWSNLLPNDDARQSYYTRIINFTSHSTLSNEVIAEPTDPEKKIVKYLLEHLIKNYGFYIEKNIEELQIDNTTE
ncbi:AAA family ATPase [Aggregatibacter actinomycetemcomitans]|uniref:AAA family ATPase n=1 Tax=Aggregatibacter actinomycetemcomitans TaxID=714 RepID=UPI0011D8BAE6|nr:AAA family ATPase [Aggregatibacter actinomycetemcomitans]QEH45567.1 AAA family ATPase [Aggregatibacter actinomycetemcomitans]QEH47706.1 AAA family ATPase [Aggregatibacter actinomycetemcomitans]QEH49503.1 AAA family ATPase [Aggregatibacter actinomycetemcomitans]TYA49554.1 AAA family ATPase [Aggregatibacter actinomycetemcomitans]TYA50650.1 AAA family ATPase [Aggregatibacter actinomycetemcomitans]